MPKYGYSMFSFQVHKAREASTPMRLGDLFDALMRAQAPREVSEQTGHGWAR